MKDSTISELRSIIGDKDVRVDEPMSRHTSFKVGGPADCFLTPHTDSELVACIKVLRREKEKYFIMGNGTNLLVSDKGYRGAVIQLLRNYNEITVFGNNITAQAGALVVKVANEACRHNLSGLEFASGIPGAIGGAITMNAGAYGAEMVKVVRLVRMLNLRTLEKCEYASSEMNFSYRHSLVKEQPFIVLEVEMELMNGDGAIIQKRMEDLKEQRVAKQPLEYASAGSTFKRPEGHYAGKLIEDTGLKGYTIGGAQVSEKHCGFIINKGHATATDILRVTMDVQKKVFDRYHIRLEPEICFLGWK